MAKIQIKTEKVTPFGGIFPIMGAFDRFLGKIADSSIGIQRITNVYLMKKQIKD